MYGEYCWCVFTVWKSRVNKVQPNLKAIYNIMGLDGNLCKLCKITQNEIQETSESGYQSLHCGCQQLSLHGPAFTQPTVDGLEWGGFAANVHGFPPLLAELICLGLGDWVSPPGSLDPWVSHLADYETIMNWVNISLSLKFSNSLSKCSLKFLVLGPLYFSFKDNISSLLFLPFKQYGKDLNQLLHFPPCEWKCGRPILNGSSSLLRKYLESNHMPSDSRLDDKSLFCEMKALTQMKAVSVNT